MPVMPDYTARITPDIGQVQRVSTGAEAIGQGMQSLGEGLQHAAKGLDAYQATIQQESDFDDQAKLRNFLQVRQNALETAKASMPAEATGFAGTFMKGQQEAEQTFLSTISPANRARYAANIQSINTNFLGLATEAERAGRSAYETNSVQQAFNGYQNTIRTNPSAREAAQADLFKSIDAMTGATPEQKLEMKQKIDNGLAFQQALGEASNDPEKMRTLVWGKQAVPAGAAPGASGRGLNNGVYNRPLTQPGASGASPVSMYAYLKSQGASDNEALVLTGAAASESSFNDRAVHDGGSGYGMFGHNLKRLDMRGKSWQQQATAALQELRSRPEGAQVNAAKNAADLATAQMHFEQPAGYTRGNPRAGDNYTGRFNTIRYFSQLKTGAHGLPPYAEAGYDQAVAGSQPANDQTGSIPGQASIAPDSRFSSLTPDQRDSLVETATRNLNTQTTAAAAAQKKQIDALTNSLENGIIDNTVGLSDIQAARKSWLTDAGTANRLIEMVKKRDEDSNNAQSFITGMQQGQQFDRFDSKTQAKADAAFKFMGSNMDALNTIYGASGIVPKSAASGLRGAIYGQNVPQASRALQIASNIMTANPNAFKGVDGGDDIAKASVAYQHYVGLGSSTDEAVRKVMEQNDPAYKSKIRVTDTDLKTFQDNITTSTISGLFDAHPWIPGVGAPSVGNDPQQTSDIIADFKQTATEFYQESGDKNLALAQAKDQLSKVYGVTNAFGTSILTKYPPEKAYPALPNDTNGGFGYIQRQAVAAVKEATGKDVDPAGITLMPIPGATQQAFTSGGVVPYRLAYHWTNAQGQEQRDVIYGKAFVADPATALTEVRAAGQKALQESDAWKMDQLQKDQAARQQLGDLYGGILTTNTQPTQVEQQDNARAAANVAKAKGLQPPAPGTSPGDIPTSGNSAFRQAVDQFSDSQSNINMSGGN